MNWNQLATSSHYETAAAIGERLNAGDVEDARRGIEELIEALSRAERRALRSQVIRLMMHIIKWKSEPHRRSVSWAATIRNARLEIADLQEDEPSLTDDVIRSLWDRCLQRAISEAQIEMSATTTIKSLTWNEVFEDDYQV
jgi:hypothetical protein